MIENWRPFSLVPFFIIGNWEARISGKANKGLLKGALKIILYPNNPILEGRHGKDFLWGWMI